MVRYGSARTLIQHKAQRGMAWLGEARLGQVRRGKARRGKARTLKQHLAGRGREGPGKARLGKAGILKHNKPPQHSIRPAGGYAPAANDSPVVFTHMIGGNDDAVTVKENQAVG